jgi:PEP-CTERM motif
MFARDILRGLVSVAFAGAVMGSAFVTSTHAAYTVTVEDVGSDVVATGVGSINLTDLTLSFTTGGIGVVNGSEAFLISGSGNALDYQGATGPSSFGVLNQNFDSSGDSGGFVGISGSVNVLFVPLEYVSGTPLSNQSIWDGESLASLGLTLGTYVYTWGTGVNADSFTVQIGAAAPEASTWAMMLVGLGALGLLGRRVRRTSASA